MRSFDVYCCVIFYLLRHTQACNYIFASYGDTGYIDSHDEYPTEQYGSNLNKCWYISPGSDNSMKFWLDNDFDVEGHASCSNDNLSIDCGGGGDTENNVRFCGTTNPFPASDPVYGSQGTTVYIEFSSNGYRQGNGFRLYYTAVDGREAHGCGTDSSSVSVHRTKRSTGAGAIVGIVFGSIVGILFLCCCCVCVAKSSGHWETHRVWVVD